MSETTGKKPKIALIAAICGVLAFLALLVIAGYATGASVIVGVLVALLVAILLWIGWFEDEAELREDNIGRPEADVTVSGLMASSGIGDEPVSAAGEIAHEPHAADTRETRSAAAAAAPAAHPMADEAETEIEAEGEAEAEAEADVSETVQPEAAPAVASAAAGADDLKTIKGVGPKIEVQLHDRGITTFAQIAALSASEIDALGAALKGTSAAQLTKWAEQARILAQGGETEFSKRVKSGDVY